MRTPRAAHVRPTRAAAARRAVRLATACALGAVGLGAVATPAGSSGRPARPAVDPPLATSVSTLGGTWASLPMGRLKDRLTTFWQLFFLADPGSGAWTDRATRLGMATNGGVLLAAPDAQSLLVGVRPSNLVHYSAFARTSGHAWTALPPVEGAASALAVGPDGTAFALVGDASGGHVVASGPASLAWRTIVTAGALGGSPDGARCAPLVLTSATAGPSGSPVLGASCAHSGSAGLFAERAGSWRSIGPALGGARVDVVSLRTSGGTLAALFALTSGSTTRLVEGWRDATGSWRLSAPLGLRGDRLVSVGPALGTGGYVLLRGGTGSERLGVVRGPGAPWTFLPRPPKGTETVAFPSTGRVDALSVAGSVMTDWVLGTGAAHWKEHQVDHVPILYGSSGV